MLRSVLVDESDDRTNRITRSPDGAPLTFEITARSGRARTARMRLPHYEVSTPVFMPVGTQATLKGLTSQQLLDLDCEIVLANTYHVGQRPGGETVAALGGLHNFMNWPRNHLTDSGGFQMVSLAALSEVTEEGVTFVSPHDHTQTLLTPEASIREQNLIGADIIMQLDDVVSSTVSGPRVREAMHRSIRWLDRSIAAHSRPREQNLFAIIQGGLDEGLRRECLKEMIARDTPGYAIGGLSGGEAKDHFWRMVNVCTAELPENKPRYCMGVGYAHDLVVCCALGVDMFDCVYPSRTARFGNALVSDGTLSLRSGACATDNRPIDPDCSCMVCCKYTRSYLHRIAGRTDSAAQLLTYHNIAFQMRVMREIRAAIEEGRFESFVREFILRHRFDQEPGALRGHQNVPVWVIEALEVAGIQL
eukprot:TRINITY_DN13760_c0_g1_i1.p1 TRINITY_DN13760_c0_g1~~TRINITY_DN13760_c0_g1_i1.p1  ORF type:complete len:468 (-),score=102.40 TRINITY_DN13760_c0_g1_i1:158-1414(-)